MPKITKFEYYIQEQYNKIDVHCGSNGRFYLTLPDYISQAMRVESKLYGNTLGELETKFDKLIRDFKNSSKTEELFILVAYQARGKYIERAEGGNLFYNNDDKYKIDVHFSDVDNAVGLDFVVSIKETINGQSVWYEARVDENGQYQKTTTKVKRNLLKRCKVLPFNDIALQTLNQAQEKFRSLSEMLFKFINQDEEKILEILTNQKLLNG